MPCFVELRKRNAQCSSVRQLAAHDSFRWDCNDTNEAKPMNFVRLLGSFRFSVGHRDPKTVPPPQSSKITQTFFEIERPGWTWQLPLHSLFETSLIRAVPAESVEPLCVASRIETPNK
eukprot:1160864-Amphidinium_carterae.1